MNLIYHLAHKDDWDRFASTPEYSCSSLSEEGFIHCSEDPEQALKLVHPTRESVGAAKQVSFHSESSISSLRGLNPRPFGWRPVLSTATPFGRAAASFTHQTNALKQNSSAG